MSDNFLTRLIEIVGENAIVRDPVAQEPYLKEQRGLFQSQPDYIVRPASTEEVAKIVSLCSETSTPFTPQGGNTGLVGGSVANGGVLLNLSRLNHIGAVDRLNASITVGAGAILADVQNTADQAGMMCALSLAAEGSCQIGGNIATNAGGTNVLRYGNMREQVLGLEVVLPDGRVWKNLKALRKDNAGYDLKQLFIGSEGTLGVITQATLRLFPKPQSCECAFVGLDCVAKAMDLFAMVRDCAGEHLSAFELMPRLGLDFVCKHIPSARDPLENPAPWYVLLELTSSRKGAHLREVFEEVLEQAFEQELICDGVLAESESQRQALWHLRESLPEAQKCEGGSIKHDVSVPLSKMVEFMDQATAAVEAKLPGIRVCAFGHMGDGNVHFNLSQPIGMDKGDYLGCWQEFNRIVHNIVINLDGSIAAEHGIGKLKAEELGHYLDPVHQDLLRRLRMEFGTCKG